MLYIVYLPQLMMLTSGVQTAFHASFSNLNTADRAVVKVSRGTSVVRDLDVLRDPAKILIGSPSGLRALSSLPAEIARFHVRKHSSGED